MAADFGRYTLDLLHEGKSILVSSNSDVSAKYYVINSLTITREVNSFPIINIKLNNYSTGLDINYNDLTIVININYNNQIQLIYSFCVVEVKITDDYIELIGVNCSYSDYTEYNSAYLGSDLESALNTLDIKKTYNVAPISGEYYQFNETKAKAFIRLLKGAGRNSIFSISNDSVKVINLNNSYNELKSYIAPDKIEVFHKNNRYKTSNDSLLKSYEVITDLRSSGDEKLTLFNYTWCSTSCIGYYNSSWTKNYLSNLRFEKRTDIIANFIYNDIIDYQLGDAVTLKPLDRIEYSWAYVIGLIYTFNNGLITTNVQLGGIND